MKRLLMIVLAAIAFVPGQADAFKCVAVHAYRTRPIMPDRYWDQVAICESSKDGDTADWRDKGKWGGGLGIYIKTWRNYGGYEFASHPSRATREEQILIANRIAVFGYQTKNEFMSLEDRAANKPFFRGAVGYNGWGCIKNRDSLDPKRWERQARSAICQKKSSE